MPAIMLRLLLCLIPLTFVAGCEHTRPPQQQTADSSVSIDFEKYTLDNGLTVILHQDTSDPLVHVDVTYHVGSAREEVGKSGFAHFFEHMMFQGSKHVADEQHFKVVTEAGGSLNGSTNSDRTNYYETVPANQLEKVLWLESDRMGFLLDAVTQKKFENQRETVKNERAQRVDNQPYGLVSERTGEALYPQGHPYSWSTIGYVEDLERVDVDDLKAFFARWYGPNNAVLTIGGDIDIAQTKDWVEAYFGPIPQGPDVDEPQPQVVTLKQDRFVTLEDNIHLPLLQITLPTVYARHPDEAPLDVLADILGGGKTSLFYKNMVKSGQAVQAGVSHPCRELACEFQMVALANPSNVQQLSALQQAIASTLAEFEQRGVTPADLARTKAGIEAGTVFGLQSVAGKVSTLAANETFYGEPDLVADDIRRYNAVTAEDVMRVYNKYVKDAKGVILSVVPKGQSGLAVAEQNTQIAKRAIPEYEDVTFTPRPTPETMDRSVMPEAGPTPIVTVPEHWQRTLAQDIPMLGVTSKETPTVTLSINLEGGMLLDPPGKEGTAYLTALMLNESTQNYSNEAMADALAQLGSAVSVSAAGRYSQIYVSTLSKYLDDTIALLEEKMLRPAFLPEDFRRMKARVMQSLQQQQKSPNQLATRTRDSVLWGENNRVSKPDEGTLASIQGITLDDIKAFYARYYSPAKASVVAVSDQPAERLTAALSFFETWQGDDYGFPAFKPFPEHSQRAITLVDKPGAVQSALYIVRRAMPYDATGDYFHARLMNFPLGGAFNSRINLNLREEKGITYAANSSFIGGKTLGWFEVSTDVKWQDTATAINAVFAELAQYRNAGMTAKELQFMKNAYTLSDALEYETPTSKARFLRQLMAYDLDDDYRSEQLSIIRDIKRDELNQIARDKLITEDLQIIVVGDKSRILEQLKSLELPIYERNPETNMVNTLD